MLRIFIYIVIPYIYSHKGFFLYILIAINNHNININNHISRCKSYSWLEIELNRQESLSFGCMPSPNIPDWEKAPLWQPSPLWQPNRFFPVIVMRCDYTHGASLSRTRYIEYVTKKHYNGNNKNKLNSVEAK